MATLESKTTGCLAAGAIGDTLGRPTEGWDYDRIAAEYGVIDDPFRDLKLAPDQLFPDDIGTDDTALALILCRAYLAKGGRVSPEDYAEAWLEQIEPRYYWYCMANTYELLRAGHSARTTGALNIVTGSGLMSVNPIAIYNAGDPERAYHDALELTSMFQRGLSVIVAGVTAAGMAEAFRPGATADSVIEAAIRLAPDEPVPTYNHRDPDNLRDALTEAVEIGRRHADPLEMRPEVCQKLLQYQSFDCQETMLLTYAVFAAAAGETRAGIVGGANIGRDTDTIASLVGQLSGALNGLDSLPDDWLETFLKLPGGRDLVAVGAEMAELVRMRARSDAAIAETVLAAAKEGIE
jgi:ADP-ribosylglycohydrolase